MPESTAEFQEKTLNRYTVKPETSKSGVYQGVSANDVRVLFRREAEVGSKPHQVVIFGLRAAFKNVGCGVNTYDDEGRVHSEAHLDENVVREIAAIIIEDQRHAEVDGKPEDSSAVGAAREFLRPFRALKLAKEEVKGGVFAKVSEKLPVARRIEAQMRTGEGDISDSEAWKFIGDCQRTLGAFLKSFKKAEAEQAEAQAEERAKAEEGKKQRAKRLLDALGELAKTKV